MPWVRALLVWLAIVVAETIHGILRGLFLVPAIGDLPSRQVGVATGSLIILVIAILASRWLGARTRRSQLQVGVTWVVLMLAFEIGLGRALGFGWDRLLADYDPRQGGFMVLGLMVLLLAPMIAARVRSRTGHAAA